VSDDRVHGLRLRDSATQRRFQADYVLLTTGSDNKCVQFVAVPLLSREKASQLS
jgi:hypothetical protein